MAFTRKELSEIGLEKEQIDKVMALHGTSMADFIPKSELQDEIDTAVLKAQREQPKPKIEESEEYKALQGEFDSFKRKVETSGTLKKSGVKDKFIDSVFAMLDSEKPAEEQLSAIKEQYEEYFETSPELEETPKPQFGAETTGSMPKGEHGEGSLTSMWGFSK